MKSVIKTKHVFVMAIMVNMLIGYAGLVNAETFKPTLNKPDQATQVKLNENYGKLPLSFIQNDGQIDEKVKFYERGSRHSTYFTNEGVYLELIHTEKAEIRNSKFETPKSEIVPDTVVPPNGAGNPKS